MNSCDRSEKSDEKSIEDPSASRQELTAKLQQMVLKGTSRDEVASTIQKQGVSTTITIRALLEAVSTVRSMERK